MARIDIRSNGGGSVATGVLQLQGGVAMTSTLTAVTDQSNTASPLKLSTTAVQITSPLRITTSDASGFYLDAEDSATNNRFSIKRDPSSQEVTLDFASNPAGSTTLVGAIRTFRDGTNLSNVMSFIEDGSIGVGTTAPVGLLDLYKAAAATRLAIRGDAGQNRLISYRTGALQRFGLYVNNTAESGSNAGSNFAIRAYDDAGTLLSTPLFIERSTGNVGIGTTTPTTKLVVNSTATALNATFDALSTATILGSQQSPLRVLRTAGQANIYIGTSNETPNHSLFLAAFRTGAWYNTSSPTYSGQYGFHFVERANDWGTQTSAADLRMAQSFTCNGNTVRQALLISPLSAESATNTDYVAVNNLLVTTAGNFGTQPTARIQIVGDGSTSATTSLLVQNYSGTEVFKTFDNGNVQIGSNNGVVAFNSGYNNYFFQNQLNFYSAATNIRGMNAGGQGLIISKNTGTTDLYPTALLAIDSTTQGFLPPRMTTAEKNAIATPAAGLMVYDTTLNKLCVRTAAAWETITSI